tara:strand:- start:724 stop:1173 length:450 start_codon:yes stop_codon:yes gene_type:complete
MSDTIEMRTSSAALIWETNVCTATFHGVLTPRDLYAFLVLLPKRLVVTKFILTDYREVESDFTSEDMFNPLNENYPGTVEYMPWHLFGAMLGREDQMPLLMGMQQYQSRVLGHVRRAFTDPKECEEWAVKISKFFSEEDANSRQERLFT